MDKDRIKVVESNDKDTFERRCNELINAGYTLDKFSIAISEVYNRVVFVAVMVRM